MPKTLTEIRRDGYEARKRGIGIASVPKEYGWKSDEFEEWQNGWADADMEIRPWYWTINFPRALRG